MAVVGGSGLVQVKQEPVDHDPVVIVKQEPVDPSEAQVTCTNTNHVHRQEVSSSSGIKDLTVGERLQQLLESHGKGITLKAVLEDLMKNGLAGLTNRSEERDNCNVKVEAGTLGKNATSSDNTEGSIVEVPVLNRDDAVDILDDVYAIKSKMVMYSSNLNSRYAEFGLESFMCNFCSFETEQRQLLLKHAREHMFKCEYCKYKSYLRTTLISHCLKEHVEFNKGAECLAYCVNKKESQNQNEQGKRKANDLTHADLPSAKKVCVSNDNVDSTGSLDMEVEEVEDNNSSYTPSKSAGDKELYSSPQYWSVDKKPSLPLPADRQTPSLPVITNVMSGQQAVSAATGNTGPVVNQQPTTVAASSSDVPPPGLYWNCGYCDFVTLNRSHLRSHLYARHHGKVHKYVAMLVSSDEEFERIKASDDKLSMMDAQNCQSMTVVHPPPVILPNSSTAAVKPAQTNVPSEPQTTTPPNKAIGIEIDNAEKDAPAASEYEKSIPVSYKCALCNFNSFEINKIKCHIYQRHAGSVMYVIDMKAVKLGQKRYVFLCLKPKCPFETKEVKDFLDHTSSCTPWLDKTEVKGVDASLIKSLKATTEFIKKSLDNVENKTKDFNPGGGVEQYTCKFCSYMAPNNTRLKKHTLTVHPSRICVFKDNFAEKNGHEPNVYFCRHCLWETREPATLELHIEKQHPDAPKTPVVQTSSNSTDLNKPATPAASDINRQHTPSPVQIDTDNNNEDEEDDNTSVLEQYESMIPKPAFNQAVEEFFLWEESRKKKRGRPMRKAAALAELQKRADQLPPLFQCSHCNVVSFGVMLIRKHMLDNHDAKSLCADNILKKSDKSVNNSNCFFCSTKDCLFTATSQEDVDKHAYVNHKLVEDLVK